MFVLRGWRTTSDDATFLSPLLLFSMPRCALPRLAYLMGLGRYVTRRHIALLQYLALIGGLYLVYCVVSDGRPQQKDTWQAERFPGAAPVREPQQRRKVPQVAGADHDWVNHPSFDHDWSKFRGLGKKDWTDHEAYESDLKRVGPGEQGSGVEIPKDRADEALALYKANGYNALVSDLIPLNRSVKDLRHPGCKALTYLEKLPTVSVILPFHEEHNSTLIRSAWSIINRTPPELLEEIILVDDCSEKPFLLKPLEEFWARNGLADKVKVLRTSKREGLIRARQLGAQAATGEVLVFLDAHSEVLYNWLPPLVDPIADDYRTVVCPFIDVIDCENYELRPQDQGARGSFDWRFDYKRLPLTRDDRNNPTRPFNSPVMAGGYFAISAKWFWELGGYDEGLDIWGGEQYELSFKVWQCHGKMVDAPCSRVGHIYRCKYSPFKSAGVGDFVSRNYKRVAEVWMDEYKEHLYNKRPSIRDAKEGDLSRMKGIRQKLQCKSFDWFMKEVAFDQDKYYPAVPPPPSTHGEVRHEASDMCIDLEFKGSGQRFGMRKCVSDSEAGTGGGDQNITVTRWHDIRPAGRDVCFDASSSNDHAPIQLFGCHSMKGNQLFKYRLNDLQIYHPISGQCLAGESSGSGELFMMKCNPSDQNQQWKWQHVDKNLLEERDEKEKEEGDP